MRIRFIKSVNFCGKNLRTSPLRSRGTDAVSATECTGTSMVSSLADVWQEPLDLSLGLERFRAVDPEDFPIPGLLQADAEGIDDRAEGWNMMSAYDDSKYKQLAF